MPMAARKTNSSGIYHIMIRIFYSPEISTTLLYNLESI